MSSCSFFVATVSAAALANPWGNPPILAFLEELLLKGHAVLGDGDLVIRVQLRCLRLIFRRAIDQLYHPVRSDQWPILITRGEHHRKRFELLLVFVFVSLEQFRPEASLTVCLLNRYAPASEVSALARLNRIVVEGDGDLRAPGVV